MLENLKCALSPANRTKGDEVAFLQRGLDVCTGGKKGYWVEELSARAEKRRPPHFDGLCTFHLVEMEGFEDLGREPLAAQKEPLEEIRARGDTQFTEKIRHLQKTRTESEALVLAEPKEIEWLAWGRRRLVRGQEGFFGPDRLSPDRLTPSMILAVVAALPFDSNRYRHSRCEHAVIAHHQRPGAAKSAPLDDILAGFGGEDSCTLPRPIKPPPFLHDPGAAASVISLRADRYPTHEIHSAAAPWIVVVGR